MEYEYVALTWGTQDRTTDAVFMTGYHRLCAADWEVSLDAPFEWGQTGGACIMRRPKDEPQEKLEPIYEYVAVLDEDAAKGQWDALKKGGWAQVRCVRLASRLGHIHLMRRIDPTVATAEVESKDKPRMWTKAKLEKVFRGVVLEVYGADATCDRE